MSTKTVLTLAVIGTALIFTVGCGKNKVTTPTANQLAEQSAALVEEDINTTAANTGSIPTEIPTDAKKPIGQPPAAVTKTPTQTTVVQPMSISSPAFVDGGMIPKEYTCQGADVNPQLNIANVPAGTKSLALIMDDPDAPGETWDHWIIWNINPQTTVITKNSAPSGAIQGMNGWSKLSYGGPCPPAGTHRYYFKLYALDTMLSLDSATDGYDLNAAMGGHILKQASLMGKYVKN